MGYRSDVSIAVYGDYDDMVAFIAAARLTEDFSTIWEECEMYPYTAEFSNAKMYMLCASFCEVKWYDHYPEYAHANVQAWHKFVARASEAKESGVNCEFARVGEDYEDTVYECYGGYAEHFIRPYRGIYEDLPPKEEDNARAG